MKKKYYFYCFLLFVACSILVLFTIEELKPSFESTPSNEQSSVPAEASDNPLNANDTDASKEAFSCLSERLALASEGALYYLSVSADGSITKEKMMDNIRAVSPMATRYSTAITKQRGIIDILSNDGLGYAIEYTTQDNKVMSIAKTIEGLQGIKNILGRNLVLKEDNTLWRFDVPPNEPFPIHSSKLQWYLIAEDVVSAREVSEVVCIYTKKGETDTQYIVNTERDGNYLSLVNFQHELKEISQKIDVDANVKELVGFPYGDYLRQGRSLSLHSDGTLMLRINEQASTYEYHASKEIQSNVQAAALIQQDYNAPFIVFQDTDNRIYYVDEQDEIIASKHNSEVDRYYFEDDLPRTVDTNLWAPKLVQMGGFEHDNGMGTIYIVVTGIDEDGELFTSVMQEKPSDRHR